MVDSRHPDFRAGEYVTVRNGWQQYALSSGQGVRKVDPAVAPVSTALGVLGMPGLTGWAGTVYLGEPRPGQTFVVSACTGPVGSTAGQVARHMGARVVGIAGSQDKCDYAVRELGFDACVNYKTGDLAAQLKAACPDGIDVYFDNVAGDTLVAVLRNLAQGARIILCGMIEAYSMDKPPGGSLARPGRRRARDHEGPGRLRPRAPHGRAARRPSAAGSATAASSIAKTSPRACGRPRGLLPPDARRNFGKALVRVGPDKT